MKMFRKENITWWPGPEFVAIAERPYHSISLPQEPLNWTLGTPVPFIAILRRLHPMFLTLPAPLISFQAPPGFWPFVSFGTLLALCVWWWNLPFSYWTSGILWGQFAHIPPYPPCVSDLSLTWRIDRVWLSLSSQGPHAVRSDSSPILLIPVPCPQKGIEVGWRKQVEGKGKKEGWVARNRDEGIEMEKEDT